MCMNLKGVYNKAAPDCIIWAPMDSLYEIGLIQINYGTKISVKVWNTDEQDNTQLDFCVFPLFCKISDLHYVGKNPKMSQMF